MSRSDYPPGYDDNRGPLYAPQGGGNYPPPPAYGFPGFGGPQPSAPYPTDPNAPLYPGQPGGYPPGPYPGQSHGGGLPGHGYPNPPPMPPIMPPTMPSDIMSSVMLRRSSRLINAGYYNLRGEPVISYRETSTYRSSRLINAGYYNLRGEPVISYRETSTYRRPKRVAPDSRKDTTKKTVRFAPEAKEANEASRNSINRWLFYMQFECLGIVKFTLALSMNGNSLDTVLSRTEGLEQQVKMLQNEMLKLKRINELPPAGTMPNFALESQGARVLPQLSSNTYRSTKPTFSIPIWKFLIYFWRPAADQSIVTQGEPIMVGRCWPFPGERGHLVIALSHPVTISHVTLGHISKTVSPNDKILSAPKMFAVYGMKTKEDEGTLLGTFLYDQDGESVQTFELSDQEEGVFSHVKLQVESNWGNPDYTCVYNFRVHGTV